MESFKFPTALVRFYLKGHLRVDQSVVYLQLPLTLLGVFPSGAYKETIPLKHISSVKRTISITERLCLLGLVLVAIGLFANQFLPSAVVQYFSIAVVQYFSMVLGVVMLLASFRHVISIEKDGRDIAWRMPFYEGKKARDIESVLTVKLYDDTDKTDLGLHGFPQTGSTRPPEPGQP